MVKLGYKGFEGLVDFPGTIGGAVVNNSGCYGCYLSNLLIAVRLLQTAGNVKILSPQELAFRFRSSALKRGDIRGVILSVTLVLAKGYIEYLKRQAEISHHNRLMTQPGPRNNLGYTYHSLGERTLLGKCLMFVSGIYYICLKMLGEDIHSPGKKKSELEFLLVGGRQVLPYLWSINRFIWKDKKADMVFLQYQKVLRRIYVNPKLEIEIFE